MQKVHPEQQRSVPDKSLMRVPKMPHLKLRHRWDEINLLSLNLATQSEKLKTYSVGEDKITKSRRPDKKLSLQLKESKTDIQVKRMPVIKHTISQHID